MPDAEKSVCCVIPTRNRRALVLEAIASVARQSAPMEIVVVDDGSSDGTAEAISQHFPEARLLRGHDLGAGTARNLGAKASKSDILMFLDSDDIWLPGHVQKLLATLDRGFEVAYGVTRTSDRLAGDSFLIPEAAVGYEGDCFRKLLHWCFLVPSCLAISRRAFFETGGFGTEIFGEDWAFLLRLAATHHFGFAGSQILSERRLHAGSLCCLTEPQQLTAGLRHLADTIKAIPRSNTGDLIYFSRLIRWTTAKMNKKETHWRTVQDWYLAMQREKLV